MEVGLREGEWKSLKQHLSLEQDFPLSSLLLLLLLDVLLVLDGVEVVVQVLPGRPQGVPHLRRRLALLEDLEAPREDVAGDLARRPVQVRVVHYTTVREKPAAHRQRLEREAEGASRIGLHFAQCAERSTSPPRCWVGAGG